MSIKEYTRGALWRLWDLHIHTPASFHWNGGDKFEGNTLTDKNRTLVDEMISAMNQAQPDVFAIMDYWTFDGWFLLQQRLKSQVLQS